jgi:DNA-binding GntR family transcriptional regulator
MTSPQQDSPFNLHVERNTSTLRQRVVEVLRNAILECRLKPGDRLIERELCELTGVSRTSVREALRNLESEGLVQNVPNRGPIVATVTPGEALQIYEVRCALEGLAGRLFAERATEPQMTDLEQALANLEAAFKTASTRTIVAETTKFYEVLLAGCGNDVISNLIRTLHARVVFLRATSMSHPDRMAHGLKEMQDIVRAITSRDAAAAQSACEVHVRNACTAALKVLRNRSAQG